MNIYLEVLFDSFSWDFDLFSWDRRGASSLADDRDTGTSEPLDCLSENLPN